jgi:hypothetical protein
LILSKRSEELSFLFSEYSWRFHGTVGYRVSHGAIYCHGQRTTWIDRGFGRYGSECEDAERVVNVGECNDDQIRVVLRSSYFFWRRYES